jgi:hypothetical protein
MGKVIGSLLGVLVLAHGCAQLSPPQPQTLPGTSWQLVKFEGGDGTVRTPDDKSKYTLTFTDNEVFNVRFDCNRGRGGWKSARAAARVARFDDARVPRIAARPARQALAVRAPYLIRAAICTSRSGRHGVYEFEPASWAWPRFARSPGAGWLRRLWLGFLSILPIEWLL